MHVNYLYLLDWASRNSRVSPNCRILDYGCGAGEIVVAGRGRGLDCYGAEMFYGGGSTRAAVEKSGLLGTIVKEIGDGHLDFPDDHFDLVLNNQVFEHVEDLDQVLSEINRVLKPGGKLLSLFPSRDVWREGHCGIPFLHRFAKDSQSRYRYALLLRRLGMGHHKGTKTPEQWASDFGQWLDHYCFYRSRTSIRSSFRRHFDIDGIEEDYILFRAKNSHLPFVGPLSRLPVLRPLAKELFRKLNGLVIEATKPASAPVRL